MQTDEEIIKILPKGLITIPKKFRESLNLTENKLLRLKEEKGRLIVEPVRTLSIPVRRYTTKEIKEFIEFDKEEARELKRKKII